MEPTIVLVHSAFADSDSEGGGPWPPPSHVVLAQR